MSERRFSTFEGVFTPCLLSILGVIMYLRLGWVVGTAGIVGAVFIICLANAITLATTLSMSSILTNIRIGTGGAYSIITKSLGVEAGGAIGIPLYISQAISVAFYITGFTECWQFIFPAHSPQAVSLAAWIILFGVALISAKLAFRVQYFILALIILSVVSIFSGASLPSLSPVEISSQTFSIKNFWIAFAVFFPAVTGILAGAVMSGELKNPRRGIPLGTLLAIGVSFIIYLVLAFWLNLKVPVQDLISNNLIVIDLGRWKWLVIAGIFGATISSALNMFIGAPRVLLALGRHSIIPFSASFTRLSSRGEPIGAVLFTALVSLITILFGSLNQIAELLTMFFLITYGMINLTVFLEQSMGIVSFRPTFRIPRIISFLGGFGCLCVMFIINANFSIISILVIIGMYSVLIRKQSEVYSPDIRSGILIYLAEKFAKAAARLPYYPKIWKPNILYAVRSMEDVVHIRKLLRAIVFPSGRVTMYTVLPLIENSHFEQKKKEKLAHTLKQYVQTLEDENIFIETTAVESQDYVTGAITAMQAIKGMYFPPNVFMYVLANQSDDDNALQVISKASREGMGILAVKYHEKNGFGKEKVVNLWIRKQSPNLDLSILIALQIERNWQGMLRLVQVVGHEHERPEAQEYLHRLRDIMRLSIHVDVEVMVGEFKQTLHQAPQADVNIFGMQNKPDVTIIHDVSEKVGTSVIFLKDSEHESATA